MCLLYNLGMDTENFVKAIESFSDLERRIRSIKQYRSQADLLKMARTCENLQTELSKEAVTCRRVKRLTPELLSIGEQFCVAVTNLEEMVTFALLLDH